MSSRRFGPVHGALATLMLVASCATSSGGSTDTADTSSATPAGTSANTSTGTSASGDTTTTSTVLITRPDVPNDPTNVVVVMTDDQTVEQMRWLPTVSAYMEQGVEFATSLTNYPLCGPSRATFLTGQHATNHGLDCNEGLAAKFHKVESNSLGPWLQEAGVHTIHVGKYLNGYGGRPETRYVPEGWDDWRALAGDSAYNYEKFDMVLNGELVQYGRNGDNDYSTDVVSEHLDEAVRAAPADESFFAVFTPLAPHYQGGNPYAVPADRHDGLVTDVLRPENLDSCLTRTTCPVDGSALNNPELSAEQIAVIDNGYQTASETLFAVDEAFAQIINTLTELSELDNTIIIFTSDNGFFYGEHGIAKGKILPGREALFVPLYIRGPGFDSGTVETSPVSNIDLAPTIVDIFDATADLESDGQSLLDPLDPDRALLVQALKAPPGGYFGTFADGWLFYDWGDLERNELYAPDDVLQFETLDDDPEWDAVEASLANLTAELKACAGSSCALTWTIDDVVPLGEAGEPAEGEPAEGEPAAPSDDGFVVFEGLGPTVRIRAGTRSIDMKWEPVDGAEVYRYSVTENDGEPSEWVRVDLDTTLLLTELDPDIEYSIEISTRRDGKWRKGTVATARPLVDAIPEPPADG